MMGSDKSHTLSHNMAFPPFRLIPHGAQTRIFLSQCLRFIDIISFDELQLWCLRQIFSLGVPLAILGVMPILYTFLNATITGQDRTGSHLLILPSMNHDDKSKRPARSPKA